LGKIVLTGILNFAAVLPQLFLL